MSYRHIQKGSIHYFLIVIGVVLVVGAALEIETDPVLSLVLLVGGTAFCFLTFMFAHLLIEDRGDHFTVQFGPVGAFRQHVAYSSIRSVELGRSTLVDGIGIHWVPRRGWIWNIRAGDCVILELERGRLRLGTDDGENLRRFLDSKIAGD